MGDPDRGIIKFGSFSGVWRIAENNLTGDDDGGAAKVVFWDVLMVLMVKVMMRERLAVFFYF